MKLSYAAAAMIGLVLLSPVLPAQAAGVDSAISICRQIEDPSGRLACYDRIGREEPISANGPRQPASKPQPIRQTVLEAQHGPDGKLIVSLANGQVWRQLDTDRADVRPGDEVTIRPGALGSYLLVGARDRRAIRVHWER
jgi:hypothetical protein